MRKRRVVGRIMKRNRVERVIKTEIDTRTRLKKKKKVVVGKLGWSMSKT